MYSRTSRLDLDDYIHEVHQGLHITSMAGTWMSVVQGFGGMRVKKEKLYFNPLLPKQWNSFSFKVRFKGSVLNVKVAKDEISISNQSAVKATFFVYEKEYAIEAKQSISIHY